MSKLSLLLRAAPAAFLLALAAPQPASAQFWGGFGGGFGPPPIPPRNVGPGPISTTPFRRASSPAFSPRTATG